MIQDHNLKWKNVCCVNQKKIYNHESIRFLTKYVREASLVLPSEETMFSETKNQCFASLEKSLGIHLCGIRNWLLMGLYTIAVNVMFCAAGSLCDPVLQILWQPRYSRLF